MPNQVHLSHVYMGEKMWYYLSFHSQYKLCIVLGTVCSGLAAFTDGQLYICAWSRSILYNWVI